MKWITRENANVDRIACPWLITRFVDADAEFLYVPAEQVLVAADREGATPYDVPGVELKYGLTGDKGLMELARIVHAADVAADLDSSPYGRGFKAIAYGFQILHGKDDHKKIALETPMYDALYAFCTRQATEGPVS